MNLQVSDLKKEGVYQGSKWLKFQVLCDKAELNSLFIALEPFFIFPLTGVVDGKMIFPEKFLEEYGLWIEDLKKGMIPEPSRLRALLACAFIENSDSLWLQEIPERGYLVKIAKPIVQVQSHYFTYSIEDHVFRPMSMGTESIFWGIQFSYPQIYQDPQTLELKTSPKNRLFETIRRWVREVTRPTPFIVNQERVNSPIRIGKNCMEWITDHPQLIARNIGIWRGN
jgi:hypothetical protein